VSDFDNTNRGALFKNDRKEKDTHPDYKGSLNVGGVDHWLDAWLKTDKNGKKFMSVSVKPKEQRQAAAPSAPPSRAPQRPKTGFDDIADDIPF
jgi:uncharacterized protein (DUF736 family)